MSKTKKIIIAALLIAIEIVISRLLSIRTAIVTIGFAFIPNMLCATWLGPKWSTLMMTIADIIGATVFPTGSYFIGYTISNALTGLIYGLLLYKKDEKAAKNNTFVIKVILSVVLVNVFINLGLNTLWTSIVTGKAYMALLIPRIIKEAIMIVISSTTFIFIEKALRSPFDKYIRSEND